MSAPSRRSIPLISSTVGGLLAIVGFFLPWYANSVLSVSGWDITYRYLTGKMIGASSYAPVGSSDIPYAFVEAIPLIVAVVAMILSGVGLFKKGTPYQNGLITAAGVIGILGLYSVSSQYLAFGTDVDFGNIPENTGLGIAVMFLGFFGILAGGLAGLSRQT